MLIGVSCRHPADYVRLWKRKQGNAALEIEPVRILDLASPVLRNGKDMSARFAPWREADGA